MLRGEFISAEGLRIPNNITSFGAESLLAGALRNEFPALWVGLCNGMADSQVQLEDLGEPLFANGYARIQIPRTPLGWPTAGEVNGEKYLESDWLTWAAVGGNFSLAVRRLMIATHPTDRVGNVFALASVLPESRLVTPTLEEAQRKFKYRIYLR